MKVATSSVCGGIPQGFWKDPYLVLSQHASIDTCCRCRCRWYRSRFCAHGDTANKIGTYNVAVVAAAHGVPFYVAAPFTTLDVSLSTGDDVIMEERPASELLQKC
jgi:hypothetical protein